MTMGNFCLSAVICRVYYLLAPAKALSDEIQPESSGLPLEIGPPAFPVASPIKFIHSSQPLLRMSHSRQFSNRRSPSYS